MDVVGIGALNFDRLHIVDKIAKGGEEIPIQDLVESPGGSAANTIVGIARLGFKSGFIGKIGNDKEGRVILEDFKGEGVDIGGIKISEGSTGVIIGFVDRNGERALYPLPGVNDSLQIRDIDLDYVKKARILHLSSFVGERPFEAQKELSKIIKGTKISFAPGMLCGKKRLSDLEQIIKNTAIFFGNESEVKMLTGLGYKDGCEALIELGVENVAVTLGERGCYVTNKDESHFVKAYQTKVRDTTGAGDAFAAGFLAGVLSGKKLEHSARLGNKLASLCISKMGAREGLPRVNVDKLL